MALALVSRDTDLAFYARQAARGGTVLVLGCADGRIPCGLAKEGARVVGVDPSESMISRAEALRRKADPEVQARLSLKAADLRVVRLTERFGLVLCPLNAIGLVATLEELDALLATVRHHLTPDGTLALDAANPRRYELHQDPDEPVPGYVEPRRALFAPHLRERDRKGPKASAGIRRLRVGRFYPAELDQALARAGLEACERFGTFDGGPFDPDGPLQVVIARPSGR